MSKNVQLWAQKGVSIEGVFTVHRLTSHTFTFAHSNENNIAFNYLTFKILNRFNGSQCFPCIRYHAKIRMKTLLTWMGYSSVYVMFDAGTTITSCFCCATLFAFRTALSQRHNHWPSWTVSKVWNMILPAAATNFNSIVVT